MESQEAMHLTLMRHAPAEPQAASADPGANDAARPLTREGRRKLRRLRDALRRADLGFDRLLYSPLTRAVETAQLLMPLVNGPAQVEPLLAAPPSEALLARLVGERPLAVGHQPWLGELVSWLVLGDRRHGEAFEWKKGGLALLIGEPVPGGMHLVGFLPPGLLRRMDRP